MKKALKSQLTLTPENSQGMVSECIHFIVGKENNNNNNPQITDNDRVSYIESGLLNLLDDQNYFSFLNTDS